MTEKEKKAKYYFDKASKAYERKDYKTARKDLEKTIKLNPKDYEAYNNYANLLTDYFKEHKKAKEYFEKAIKLNPKKINSYGNLAVLLEEHFQEYEKAKQYYKKIIELDPNDANVYYNLALLLDLHFKEYKKAKQYYAKAVELNSNNADLYYCYANILTFNFNEHEKAKQYYEKAIELNPKDLDACIELAVIYYKKDKNIKKAQEYFMRAIEINPKLNKLRRVLKKISNFNKPTFISEFDIKNVRHLRDIEIPISSNKRKHLFLTGKNGSGKTSVLKQAENYMQQILDIPIKEIFTEKGQKEFWQDIGEYKLKFKVTQNLLDLRIKYEAGNYVIVFFDDERKLQPIVPKHISPVELELKNLPKEDIGKDFIKYLVHRDYMMKSGEENENINELFEKIREILKEIYKNEKLEFKLNAKELDFYIKLPNGNEFTFNQLAAGYSAILKIIFEIILRTRNKPNQTNTEGIILIDEPETHLHIEMQKEIMPILIKMFPNVQFVVATHSPFILNSISNAVIYDMETHSRAENFSEIPANKINDYYFTFNEKYVRQIETKVLEFERLINLFRENKITEKDKNKLAELEIELDEITPYISEKYRLKFKENQKYIYE